MFRATLKIIVLTLFCFVFSSSKLYSQYTSDDIRAAYLYYFVDYFDWQFDSTDVFKIACFTENKDFVKKLEILGRQHKRKIVVTQKIQNKIKLKQLFLR